MKLILKKLTLKNFKGVQNQEIIFDENETFIFGRNGAGKSTIEDAWSWLITGKDRDGNMKFGIKPVNAEGKTVDKLDNEVTASLSYDGKEIVLRKVHKEKWTKPRGSSTEVYEGNEIVYAWQESEATGLVKVTKTVYEKNIGEIIPLEKLALLTNVRHFLGLPKDKRRALLIALAGDMNMMELLGDNQKFQSISDIISSPKLLAAAKASTRQKINDAKKKLAEENTRIDENKTRIGGLQRPFDRLRTELAREQAELDKINNAINNKQEAYKEQDELISTKRKERHSLQGLADGVSNGLRVALMAKSGNVDQVLVDLERSLEQKNELAKKVSEELSDLATQIKTGEEFIASAEKQISEHEERKVAFRKVWADTNAETLVFKENEFCCPACKREFEADDRLAKEEELTSTFNTSKAAKVQALREQSEQIKQLSADLDAKLKKYQERLAELKEKHASKVNEQTTVSASVIEFKEAIATHKSKPVTAAKTVDELLSEELSTHAEFIELNEKINAIDKELLEFKPIDTNELLEQRKPIEERIKEINTDLQNEKQIKDTEERIEELQTSASQLAQQIADEEKKEFLMEEFDRLRMDEVESRVNSMFSLVKFQMFSVQENGEVIDDCLVISDGKDYDKGRWNSALTINCGIDIINTLSKKENIYLPIMVDNRESTTDIIPSESQIINLVVSPHDKVLRVENEMIFIGKEASDHIAKHSETLTQGVVQGTLL